MKTFSIKAVMRRQRALDKYLKVIVKSKLALNKLRNENKAQKN